MINIINFEKQLKALCNHEFGESGSIPQEIQKLWIANIKERIIEFGHMDFDEISEALTTLRIEGINENVIITSASILAYSSENDNMAIDYGSSICFMSHGKGKGK